MPNNIQDESFKKAISPKKDNPSVDEKTPKIILEVQRIL
jgi:hypothetical protein